MTPGAVVRAGGSEALGERTLNRVPGQVDIGGRVRGPPHGNEEGCNENYRNAARRQHSGFHFSHTGNGGFKREAIATDD